MIANGVVRGRPLFRPRMVMSPLDPNGTPAANRNLTIALKNGIHRGIRPRCIPIALVAPATNTLIINSLIQDYLHPIRQDGSPGCDTSEHPGTATRARAD